MPTLNYPILGLSVYIDAATVPAHNEVLSNLGPTLSNLFDMFSLDDLGLWCLPGQFYLVCYFLPGQLYLTWSVKPSTF